MSYRRAVPRRPLIPQPVSAADDCRRRAAWHNMGCEPELGGLMPYVNRAGLRLFYAESGTGLPVLWHTGGCGDATMSERAGYLAALPGYRHILFDHRGHGRSEGPADMAGHHMECYVDDVIAVLDDAGIDRAVLIGYSQGGRVGYAVAGAHPQRLAGLVALDSVPDPDEQAASLRDDAGEVIARGTAAVIEEMAADESEPPPAWLLDHLCATDPFAFAGAYEAFATAPAFWPAAGQITVPPCCCSGLATMRRTGGPAAKPPPRPCPAPARSRCKDSGTCRPSGEPTYPSRRSSSSWLASDPNRCQPDRCEQTPAGCRDHRGRLNSPLGARA
jgi:pimeloyl-ACP methyl ester carboxylesterase